jgi:calcium-dependent protein kinase
MWCATLFSRRRIEATNPHTKCKCTPPPHFVFSPRDLKPENCIYSTPAEDSPLKITDFGLAALLTPESERLFDRHLVGTPGYIAPEILTNYEYSPASDLWAAGVILFILLSGSPPFYGRTHKEIFEKIKAGHWGFHGRNWGQVSDGAKDLVKKMLKQAPGERLSLAGVLEHPWIREHESLSSAHLPDTLESLAKFNARQKFRAAAMVCIGSSRLQRVLAAVGGGAGSGKAAAAAAAQEAEAAASNDVDLSAFSPEELERLKEEFSRATEGSSNTCLSLAQFEGVMATLGLDHLPVARLFHAFDLDGTGDVDYREFLLGVSKFRLKGPDALKCACTHRLPTDPCGCGCGCGAGPIDRPLHFPHSHLASIPSLDLQQNNPHPDTPTPSHPQSASRSSTRTTRAPSRARS